MSSIQKHAVLDAPIERVWQLVADPNSYADWWPAVIEVDGETFEEGAEFVQVSQVPLSPGNTDMSMMIDRRDELRAISMHCTLSGAFMTWQLTGAQGGTFLEIESGMNPISFRHRVFDTVAGRLVWRRWLDEALSALERAVAESATASDQARRR